MFDGGQRIARVLAQILVLAGLAWARYSATERSCPAIISAVHFSRSRCSRCPTAEALRPAAPEPASAWPRRVSTGFALAPLWSLHQHFGDVFQFRALAAAAARCAPRVHFLAATFGGPLHEGDVIDRLADRLRWCRPPVASTGVVWFACMSAAMSGTSVALPADQLSQ